MKKFALAIALSSLFQLAHANVIGANSMINAAGESQLETWLGQGQLTFTNIFSKTAGSTAANFHAAADGKGATLTLMSVSANGGQSWETIGGYNPLSWDTSADYHYSSSNQYAAFIFNLTDSVKRAQTGAHQTFNYSNYGPTFGGGHDIFVDSNLSNGHSYGYSYGGVTETSIVTQDYNWHFAIRSLDVYTLSADTSTAVPEPTSLALAGIGLLALALRRKKAQAA